MEYGGYSDYPIRHDKIEAIITNAPKDDLLDIAAYYLKNIILLQPFADANHRTALNAVELFLIKNGLQFDYTAEESEILQETIYRIRSRIYGTYEEGPVSHLFEVKNENAYPGISAVNSG